MSEKRSTLPVVRYEGLESGNLWTESEKRVLLSGLRRYGHTDIQRISETLPSKSSMAIKNMITNLKTAARRSTKYLRTPPIDMWLQQASIDDTNSLIPQALYFISMFERHPPSEECDGCDLNAAYDYIYRMTRGDPAIELPTKTRKMILKIISKTVSKRKVRSNESLMRMTHNFYKSSPGKDYTRRSTVPQKIGLYKVLRELNTFSVPGDRLRTTEYI